MRSIDIIHEAYSALKPNEAYWTLDNDYSRKYRYICECVEDRPSYTPETFDYIADCARFLMNAHSRIFK